MHGRCAVGFLGQRHLLTNYQVLVDLTSTSRLEWRHWNIFTKLPVGLVAYTEEDEDNGSTYVARNVKEDKFGDLSMRRGLSGNIAVLDDSGLVKFVTEGEILVEVEPVKYSLEKINFHHGRMKTRSEEVELNRMILANDYSSNHYEQREAEGVGEDWAVVRSVVDFNATYHYYWGQLPGLIKALPATAETFSGGELVSFRWALPLSYSRQRIQVLSTSLRSGTALLATVTTRKVTREVPYTAKLEAIFADGKRKRRHIEANYVETLLESPVVNYGRPYFIRNGSFAPTTSTTTTTTTPSTTTVTSTTTSTTTTLSTATKSTINAIKTTTVRLQQQPVTTTVDNPLRRFYPSVEEDEDVDLTDMQSDDAEASRRSQPSSGASTANFRVILVVTLITRLGWWGVT